MAAATRTDAPSLRRVLRALASVGVFTEASSAGTFALTPLAALLRTGTRDSMRALAIMYAEEQYRAWAELLHSVQTGETAFERQFGTTYFAYLGQHPEADRVFNEAMAGWTTQLVGAVLDALSCANLRTAMTRRGRGPLMRWQRACGGALPPRVSSFWATMVTMGVNRIVVRHAAQQWGQDARCEPRND